ncbi:FAD-dependent monooxygenase [Streptomyces sp. NPDC006422]|uniref:FAD-dependent monooxygenase n=1 Tax=unclassified Streptomyces TaxID=2593676 RepID=UPI0033B71303
MQFHLDGYRPGDPSMKEAHPAAQDPDAGLPETADVLIVGCGPAGLVLAAQLAAFPGIRTVVVDRKDGPLLVGQADGVACRTVEMFEAFGLAERLKQEAYQVNEVTFWKPDPTDSSAIVRTGRIDDVEEGISEMPHLIVNQARMLDFLREHMARSASRLMPHYSLNATAVYIARGPDAGEYPVTVTLEDAGGGTSVVRAKYVVGTDGARSSVRKAIGRRLEGDALNQTWGVLDVLVDTDFPDIRLKSVIQSEAGSLLIIPREGGYLVRLYIELDAERYGDLLREKAVTPEVLAGAANRILRPYRVEVKDVGWWAVYEVGQRLCSKFDDVPDEEVDDRLPRVFIAGDACHTHSAKAGQGMNVSMADAFNLGWKLAAVLNGTAAPELLHTYSAERQRVAQGLIDFDRDFASKMAAGGGTKTAATEGEQEEFSDYFRAQGLYTAGLSVRYEPSMITGTGEHQHLAKGFPIGMRFHSAPVVRLADARPVHLGHAARADGAWRLYLFADRMGPQVAEGPFRRLCDHLASAASPLARFTPEGADPDAVIDVRAILQQPHRTLEPTALPAVLRPRKGRFALVDHEKVFCPDPRHPDIFDLRGIDRDRGCMVLVRPDQYVAHVLPLDAIADLSAFFEGVLREARSNPATA